MRRLRARNEHGADHEVGAQDELARSPGGTTSRSGCDRARSGRSRAAGRRSCRPRSPRPACPAAISAAFQPAMPPPSTTTCAGATPLAPPISTPRPPCGRSRYFAPSCGAIRPAISDIGASRGSRPSGSLHRLVGDGAHPALGQEPREPLVGGQMQVREQDVVGAEPLVLLGLRLLDLHDQVGGARTRRRRRARSTRRRRRTARRGSPTRARRRPGRSPRAPRGSSSRTPSGVAATRYSWFLTSVGIPIRIAYPISSSAAPEAGGQLVAPRRRQARAAARSGSPRSPASAS